MIAVDYSTWSVKPDHLDENMVRLYERFLLGSLATGASKMSSDFISALGITTTALAEGYLTKLAGEKICFDFKELAADVEEAVTELGADPWDATLPSYFIAVRSAKDELDSQIQSLPEYKEAKDKNLGKEVTPLIKRRFFEIDTIYRRLRNALAHGCFRLIAAGDQEEERLFFYDIDTKGNVSCCSLVPFAMLDQWYEASCRVANKKL